MTPPRMRCDHDGVVILIEGEHPLIARTVSELRALWADVAKHTRHMFSAEARQAALEYMREIELTHEVYGARLLSPGPDGKPRKLERIRP